PRCLLQDLPTGPWIAAGRRLSTAHGALAGGSFAGFGRLAVYLPGSSLRGGSVQRLPAHAGGIGSGELGRSSWQSRSAAAAQRVRPRSQPWPLSGPAARQRRGLRGVVLVPEPAWLAPKAAAHLHARPRLLLDGPVRSGNRVVHLHPDRTDARLD